MNRLHPATIVVAILPRIREAIQASLPIIIGSFAAGGSGHHDWIAIMIGSFTGVFAIGAYLTTRFAIEPNHVVHTSGWIFRKDRRIPLEQIQNVNIRQNLLERIFRVATIDVETAMGHGRDLKLSVLGIADAERFRDELLTAAHLDVPGRTTAEEPIVSLNRHDLLLGALTENHIQQMVVGMVTVIGPGVGWLMTFASKLPPAGEALLFLGSLALFVLGSWLWGAGSYYLKYGGFVVYRNESVFRISYGLLNKVQMAIRPNRIEYLRLTTTLPQRWMGRTSLKVGTAGSFSEAGVLAPVALFVDNHRAHVGASNVFPGLDLDHLNWSPFHPVFYLASVSRALFTIGFLAGIATLASFFAGTSFAVLAWVLFGFLAAMIVFRIIALFLSRTENGFSVSDNFLVVRQGYYHQSVCAMPIRRMENASITQPFWWKRFGACRFSVQGMKHRVYVGAMPESSVKELLAHWYARIDEIESIGLVELMPGMNDDPLDREPFGVYED